MSWPEPRLLCRNAGSQACKAGSSGLISVGAVRAWSRCRGWQVRVPAFLRCLRSGAGLLFRPERRLSSLQGRFLRPQFRGGRGVGAAVAAGRQGCLRSRGACVPAPEV